jgi:hypothetical protein
MPARQRFIIGNFILTQRACMLYYQVGRIGQFCAVAKSIKIFSGTAFAFQPENRGGFAPSIPEQTGKRAFTHRKYQDFALAIRLLLILSRRSIHRRKLIAQDMAARRKNRQKAALALLHLVACR